MYKTKVILGLFNQINLTPKELLLKMQEFNKFIDENDGNERLNFYLFEVDVINGKNDYGLTKKEKNQNYYCPIFDLNVKKDKAEEVENKFFDFFKGLDENYIGTKEYNYLFYSNKYKKGPFVLFEIKNDYRQDLTDLRYYFKLNIGTENLSKDNIFELLQLYLNFFKINTMQDLKQFKTMFFGNITAKIFDTYLDELANEGKITIEKSKTNAVKLIKLNTIKISKIEEHLNKLRQKGIIKTNENYYGLEFEINNYNPFKNLKLHFKFHKNKEKTLEMFISNNNFDYFKATLNELNDLGIYDTSEILSKLRINIIQNVLIEIEKILELEILNKNFLTNYNCGFHLFIAHNKV